MIKLTSWNVNGLRAIIKKNFVEYFKEVDSDIFCLQEIKLQKNQIDFEPDGYFSYWNYAVKKGYSGTAIFTKIKPKTVSYGLNMEKFDQEGRVITLEFENYFLVNVYTPNSKGDLSRLSYRIEWDNFFKEYLMKLNEKKGVVVCGDFNVAHKEIDIKNPKTNNMNAGFTKEERTSFSELLNAGFIDSFRYFNPTLSDVYSWWSYRFGARTKNIGWRLDYFLVSNNMKKSLVNASIKTSILGSDHCPIELIIQQI